MGDNGTKSGPSGQGATTAGSSGPAATTSGKSAYEETKSEYESLWQSSGVLSMKVKKTFPEVCGLLHPFLIKKVHVEMRSKSWVSDQLSFASHMAVVCQ
jgi:hypothetical protein